MLPSLAHPKGRFNLYPKWFALAVFALCGALEMGVKPVVILIIPAKIDAAAPKLAASALPISQAADQLTFSLDFPRTGRKLSALAPAGKPSGRHCAATAGAGRFGIGDGR